MESFKDCIYKDQSRMRFVNQMFTYILFWFQFVLDFMPPFIRNVIYKHMVKKCGEKVVFDYNIFIKFPWLVEIGSNVSINRGGQFFPAYKSGNMIKIGNDVYLGPNVCFFASGHDVANFKIPTGGDIIVGKNVWLGGNTTVLPGVIIGDNCVVGAGSVVSKSIPSNSIAVGVPARVIKHNYSMFTG
ncbi:DapH/DapD/GlmU-related protein [Desulfosediminicola sp.]